MQFRQFLARVRTGVPRRTARLVRQALRGQLLRGRLFSPSEFDYAPQSGSEAIVLMCLWNRPSRGQVVLDMLDTQDFPEGINLYLWNNNPADHAHYKRVLRQFRGSGNLHRVTLARSPYNLGSIGRFYWARKLAGQRPNLPIIVLDDDQDITPDFVSVAMREFDGGAITAWWAWTVHSSYHDRVQAGPGDRVDHVGPGGSVMSADIFTDSRFFTDIPEQFRMLDDVWLTNFAVKTGYRLAKLPVEIDFVMNETNQYHGQIDMKTEFYNYLYR
ncbi:hypothetical protein IWX81_002362 [Salinibacterium sp. CAN_S4]|uniref:hypothetical protein n=1 Tax=Salinibacterium sp. CAN_S4 TaxID=2787727 RepID=UPI0018EF61BC